MYINKIETLLRERKIKFFELANAIGFSRQGLKRTFNENTLKVSTLAEIAKYFNLPVVYFFQEKEYDYAKENEIIDNAIKILGNIVNEGLNKQIINHKPL
jgi:transcriptional regulator with XRE-family HTH domain